MAHGKHIFVHLSCPLRLLLAFPPTWANSLKCIWCFIHHRCFPFLFEVFSYVSSYIIDHGSKPTNHLLRAHPSQNPLCSSWRWSALSGSQPAHKTTPSGVLWLCHGHEEKQLAISMLNTPGSYGNHRVKHSHPPGPPFTSEPDWVFFDCLFAWPDQRVWTWVSVDTFLHFG